MTRDHDDPGRERPPDARPWTERFEEELVAAALRERDARAGYHREIREP
jgi:hypothetical protein